ncbi:phosphomevalonate kinase [Nocardia rhizosphaerihabitans]|uniref:phosphomevalonate kinase n=1 Tax=Nocardia rhizosphaerihabitans TaxID=1691570 RepID=A0ABQ2K4I0_9NOCA|nr:phosphomevalonate kinase [Nocardia rhizosphaerihabitans]GGN67424.1 phosphomevalonate kinase [Nocardia rhizosphaerihabitans]
MISCRAPGKLFIAGEYAVVEPGHLAVLTAVDRYATATVADAAAGVAGEFGTAIGAPVGVHEASAAVTGAVAGVAVTLRSDLDGGVTLDCGRDGERLVPLTPDAVVPAAFAYVFAAASVIDRLLTERGIPSRPYEVDIVADLGDADGRKYGLGSSAAVTVATIAALGQFHELELTAMQRYRLAMLATIAVNPRASGGDVAVSTWGGWLAYGSPDRAAVAEIAAADGIDAAVHAPWPGLSVRPLPTPTGLALQVGWTGNPASTPALVAGLGTATRTPGDRATFNARSNDCVQRLLTAIEADDSAAVGSEIDRARELLLDLDQTSGLGIMTPRLHALCAAGIAVGAAAKPSGAGGGDCGIALVDRTRTAAIAELTGRWIAAGIQPLPLRTHPFEGETA